MIDLVKPAEVPLHPAAILFPEMSASEFASLKSDIKANGLTTPVTLWRGQVVDGRHRVRACNELGIDWQATAVSLPDSADPYQHAISANATRRQLTKSQLSMIAVEHRAVFGAQARSRQGRRTDLNLQELVPESSVGQSRDQLGKQFGISGKLVDAARAVSQHGAPTLIEAVKSGQVPVLKAATIAKGLPAEEQAKAVAANRVQQVANQLQRKPKPVSKPKPEEKPDVFTLVSELQEFVKHQSLSVKRQAVAEIARTAVNLVCFDAEFMECVDDDPTKFLQSIIQGQIERAMSVVNPDC